MKIGELAQEAQTRFETADYAGAIDLWTKAYAALPEEPAYAQQRSVLVYQIAQASVEAYSLDPQVLYLRKAERLLTSYLETIDASDGETIAAVEDQLAELREKIAAASPEQEEEPEPAPDEVEPEPEPVTEPAAADDGDARPGRALMISGGVLLGLGAASLGVATYGLVWGDRVDARGEAAKDAGNDDVDFYRGLLDEGTTANRLALGAGIAGAVLVGVGAGLLGVGAAKSRKRRDVAWVPLGLVGGGGLQMNLRF
ncbi:MAG: hypothetical protein KC486_03690 [Myxococcales bacterium]|nr:hypothetical protein [Myxococcales bacterium]